MTEASRAYRFLVAGDTHIGKRQYNEDSVLLRPDLDLFLLADGAGGHNAGNVASALAVTAIAHHFEETQTSAENAPDFDLLGLSPEARRLAAAVQQANREVIEVAKTSDRHQGMGTTVVAASFDRHRGLLHLAHVGDSRCYRLRDGRIELLTRDHTLFNDVLELRPDLPEAQAATLPRNVITRALGMSDQVRVAMDTHAISPGDRYLLCSDGLTDVVDESDLAGTLSMGKKPEVLVKRLLEMAIESGRADDNVAVIAVVCDLLPGTGAVPQPRVRPRTSKRKPSIPPPPDSDVEVTVEYEDDDFPEIIYVDGSEEEDIHVVPTQSASPALRRTLRGLMRSPLAPPIAPPVDAPPPPPPMTFKKPSGDD
jgi:protein phosphatase